jgi:hypothetical protein
VAQTPAGPFFAQRLPSDSARWAWAQGEFFAQPTRFDAIDPNERTSLFCGFVLTGGDGLARLVKLAKKARVRIACARTSVRANLQRRQPRATDADAANPARRGNFENAAAQEASYDQAVGRQRGRGKKEERPFFAFPKARASPTHRM